MYIDINLRVFYDINGQSSLQTKHNRRRLYDISMSSIIDLNMLCASTISYGRLIKCLIIVVHQQSMIIGI